MILIWLFCTLACSAVSFVCALSGVFLGERFARWYMGRKTAHKDEQEHICKNCGEYRTCVIAYGGFVPVKSCGYWRRKEP